MATTLKPAEPLAAPEKSRRRFAWPVFWTVAAVLIFVLYQFILPESSSDVRTWFREWLPLTSLNEALVYAMLAIGLNIVVGYAGLLDLGFVAFWAIGGYTAGWIMSAFIQARSVQIGGAAGSASGAPVRGIHLSFWAVLIAGVLLCALFGVIIGAPTLRLRSDYLAIVTLAFGEIIAQFFTNSDNVFGNNIANGPRGISPVDPIGTGIFQVIPGVPERLTTRAADLPLKFVIFALLTALVIFVSLRIREGKLGRAWLAIREDELAASMMGVPLMRTKLAAYAVGAATGGLGGVAFATHVNGVFADRFNFSVSIILLAMVVLGGMGNVWGVMLGAVTLAWINSTGLPRLGDTVNEQFGTSINFPAQTYLIFGGILVLMMLFRREGLLPETRTRQLIHAPERGELESVGADIEGGPEEVDGRIK